MAQFIAMHNLPYQAADHLSKLFPDIFPDSKIAADCSWKHKKTKAIICDTLNPNLSKCVIDTLDSVLSIFYMMSHERGDSVKLLTVLARFLDPLNCSVVTCHLDTIGITDCSAAGAFIGLRQVLEKSHVPFTHLMSFTSDTCNVMRGACNGVITKLREVQHSIIDINCICHLLNLCVNSSIYRRVDGGCILSLL